MAKVIRGKDGTVMVERFTPFQRIEHVLGIITFLVLCLTGFPQKYYEAEWAGVIFRMFGGLDWTRTIHHVVGVFFSLQLVVHLGFVVGGAMRGKFKLTMLPTTQDVRDAVNSLLYYLGRNNELPRYPKFNYGQKFEYVSLLFGTAVMILSGLILLYPVYLANYLPGQLIPAARLAHSNEALLALIVILTWHFYGSHVSPAVFPMDKTIFTGYMTEEELKERHGLEYDRIFGKEDHAGHASDNSPFHKKD